MEEILKEYGVGVLEAVAGFFFLAIYMKLYDSGGMLYAVVTKFLAGVCG